MKIKNIALLVIQIAEKLLYFTLQVRVKKLPTMLGLLLKERKVLLNYLLVMQYEYWTYPELIV
jgi:hypothetical protein